MYTTDFREEALKHVIESLDPALFERVTGLAIHDFKLLNDLGLFSARNMDAAIYQFRRFERESLRYADAETADKGEDDVPRYWVVAASEANRLITNQQLRTQDVAEYENRWDLLG